NKTDERRKKERQKQLRKGLLAFLKRLRQACKSYESLGDWNDLIQPLESMLDEHAQDFPQGRAQRLREAMNLKAATAEGIQAGCQVLQKEIEGVVDLLRHSGAEPPVRHTQRSNRIRQHTGHLECGSRSEGPGEDDVGVDFRQSAAFQLR
ncbi:MAG: hypothetical protein P8Z00_20880, partial [Anaerolineales bacterium]